MYFIEYKIRENKLLYYFFDHRITVMCDFYDKLDAYFENYQVACIILMYDNEMLHRLMNHFYGHILCK